MTTYSQTRYAGPPTGYYAVGDVVTDMNGVKWVCTASGYPSVFSAQPNLTTLESDLSETVDLVGGVANLTGFLSNATGSTWTLTATVTADGLAHKVTIKNDSATNHSAKTALLTGTDSADAAQTETVALPNSSATVTSTKSFKTLTTVVPSATIGGDTMDIGWATLLPTPAVAHRGKLRMQSNPGVGTDTLHICVDSDGSGTYLWKTVTLT